MQSIIKGLEKIDAIIGKRKFLLVRDSAYDFLNISFVLNKLPHVEFAEFTPNPLYEQVCKGVEVFNENQCELIVAVGGGSTIDVAKCIKLFCKMNRDIIFLHQEKVDSGIPLIAIPTTAGTGSESTCHAAIYYNDIKQSISHYSIIPDYAVLEPSVLETLPMYQKKCTLLDALCQAIESWWSVNSTDESKSYSQKAIDIIKANWETYIFGYTDLSAEKIMEAANYAGRAINITATTAAHAMSYKISSMYNFPHGHAVAVCLPEVWEYMNEHTDNCIDLRGEVYLKRTLEEISERINLNYYLSMMKTFEMNYPISNDRDKDLQILVQSVNPERLKNNPIKLTQDVLREMYGCIVK